MSGTPRIASPGNPPLLWSDIEQAFRAINQNFNELYATIQADGSTQVVNFSDLYDDVSPAVDGTYELGNFAKSWKRLNLSSHSDVPGSETNGLWLGLAHVIDDGVSVVLPVGSKVDNDLIIDPAKTFWKTFNIDDENFVEATEFADTLNINSGTAIQIIVDSGAESLTFNNTGVTSLIAGTGTSVSSATGNITVTNTGVLTLTNGSTLPSGLPAGSGISVSSSTGNISLTNTGVIDVQNGFGITVSRDNATGIVTVTNSAPAQVAYRTITVAGSSDLVADTTSDTLVIEAGYGMVITTTEIVDDTLVLAVDQNIDITGSVFADDSTIMVDTIDQTIYAAGGFFGDLTGYHTGDVKGSVFGDDSTKIVDAVENEVNANKVITPTLENSSTLTLFSSADIILNASTSAYLQSSNGNFDIVASNGYAALSDNSGAGNISISDLDGSINLGTTGTITIQGAAGSAINIGAGTSGNVTVGNGSNQLIVNGTLMAPIIDTTDSSAITVVPPVTFNTDVNFENELFIQNSRVIAIAELQDILAASTNFADFQARIAAL
jgi:hypothetical protein